MHPITLYFHLERGELQLFNNKGFTLIEVLIATTILLLTVSIVFPLTSLLHQERKVLRERRIASAYLHDELQLYLWTETVLPATYTQTRQYIPFRFHFTNEDEWLKGCISWENARQTDETICLYGLPKQS